MKKAKKISENISLLNKEEKVKKVQESLIKSHSRNLIYTNNPIEINWRRISPVVYQLVDVITEIIDQPTFLKDLKPYHVQTYDVSDQSKIDSILEIGQENDIVFYSLMEMDASGHNPPTLVLRMSPISNPYLKAREKRDKTIDQITKDDDQYYDEYH